jgi:hypothetical protein
MTLFHSPLSRCQRNSAGMSVTFGTKWTFGSAAADMPDENLGGSHSKLLAPAGAWTVWPESV